MPALLLRHRITGTITKALQPFGHYIFDKACTTYVTVRTG